MAALRPATRLVSRQFTRTTHASPAVETTILPAHSVRIRVSSLPAFTSSRRQIHTTQRFLKDDSNFTSSGRGGPEAPANVKPHRVVPRDPESNDAYPDGAPGEPKAGETLDSGIPPATVYSFEDIASIANAPDSYPNRILIDVREAGEVLDTGRIPGAVNIPISSAPDAFFLNAEDFEDKYGFARPGQDKEVIFYCKAGVRSNAAARLAGQAGFGGKYGEFPGSWVEWYKKGGKVQRE